MPDQEPIPLMFRSPHTKVVGKKPLRARYTPRAFPSPHYVIDPDQLLSDRWPVRLSSGMFASEAELNLPKLRGLSPIDSLIAKLAISAGLLHPGRVHLSALIPFQPDGPDATPVENSRNLLECSTAPTQCDLILDSRPSPPGKPADDFAPGLLKLGVPEHSRRDNPRAGPPPPPPSGGGAGGFPVEIIEVKPNAGYVAFGQVLTYLWLWSRKFGGLWPAHASILTDLPRPYLPDLAASYGVSLLTLGRMVVDPPNYPT